MISKLYFSVIFYGFAFAMFVGAMDLAKRPWIPYWTTEEMYVTLKYGKFCLFTEVCPYNGLMIHYEKIEAKEKRHVPAPEVMASKEELERVKKIAREILTKLDEGKHGKH